MKNLELFFSSFLGGLILVVSVYGQILNPGLPGILIPLGILFATTCTHVYPFDKGESLGQELLIVFGNTLSILIGSQLLYQQVSPNVTFENTSLFNVFFCALMFGAIAAVFLKEQVPLWFAIIGCVILGCCNLPFVFTELVQISSIPITLDTWFYIGVVFIGNAIGYDLVKFLINDNRIQTDK